MVYELCQKYILVSMVFIAIRIHKFLRDGETP